MNTLGNLKNRRLTLIVALVLALPLGLCAQAQARASAQVTVTPSQIGFGNVAIGASVSQSATFLNTSTAQVQVQFFYLLAGTPSVFPVTADTCSGQMLDPGSSCYVTLGFQPDSVGYREGSMIFSVIASPSTVPQPVVKSGGPMVVGFSGTGMPTPGGAASITGNRAAGAKLTCGPAGDPAGATYAFRWFRNGHRVVGATGSQLALQDANVGQSFSCQIVATNPVGTQTMTSPLTGPIAPMRLTTQAGAFTDEWTCRTVEVDHALRLGGETVHLAYEQPVTPWSPLTLTSANRLHVRLDGRGIGAGKVVAVSPRTLFGFGDGVHRLQLDAARSRVETQLLVVPCQLAARLNGGPGQASTLSASSLFGMSKLTFRLPSALHITATSGRKLGWVAFKSAVYPVRGFNLIGTRTTWNNVSVTLTSHTVTVTNLPIQTGVVSLTFRSGVLAGNAGVVSVSARERGQRALILGTTPATWLR